MRSIVTLPEVDAGLDALDAAVAVIAEFDFDALPPAVRLRALERMETARRRQIAVSNDVIAGLAKEDPADVSGPVHKVVADWLRISCAEACRRDDEVPPELLAFDGTQYKTNATWNAALDQFKAARAQWAAERNIPLDQMPDYTVGDEPWDPSWI